MQVVHRFYHDGMSVGLPLQSYHFGMSGFPVYHYLCVRVGSVCGFYLLLQAEHYWARGVYECYVVVGGEGVGGWRLAMGTQEHAVVVEAVEVGVRYGVQPEARQAVYLLPVVHYVA